MNKAFSILLLISFISHHFGYYLVYYVHHHQVEKVWAQKVYNEDFSGQRVMSIPMKLPYVFDQEDFQLTNISFKKDGKSFRVIKKRFIDDAFELIYVPDKDKIKLELNLKQWVITMVPSGNNEPNGEKVLSKNFIKDYLPKEPLLSMERSWRYLQNDLVYFREFFQDICLKPLSPPPQLG